MSLASDLTQVLAPYAKNINDFKEYFTLVENDGYLNSDGSIHAQSETNGEKYTDAISVNGGEKLFYTYKYTDPHNMWVAYVAYDENDTIIGSRVNVLNKSPISVFECGSFVVPANAKKIQITYRTHGETTPVSLASVGHSRVCDLYDKIDASVDAIKDDFTIVENDGYLNSDGDVHEPSAANGEKYTDLIPVSGAEKIFWNYNLSSKNTMWLAYIPYSKDGAPLASRTNIYSDSSGKKHASGTLVVPASARGIKLTYRAHGEDDTVSISSISHDSLNVISNNLDNNDTKTNLAFFAGRFKPCYDHLFVGRKNNDCTIPHESLYHIRLSRRLGFNIIEANVAYTSDGVYFVNHLNQRKFDGYFHHIDGETDISNVNVNTVTWDWITENVRYNSSIPKYRTRPVRLDEFLGECKQQNIIPFITSKTDSNDYLAIADKYMGKGNYIAYGATREQAPDAIIYHYKSDLSTKEDILAYCKSIGAPFIYGLSNIGSFTNAQLKELIDLLHENGFWIGVSYKDNDWYKYSYLGFDFNATQTGMNRISNGNICNFDTIFGFGDFTVTNATESDGVLTCSSGATIQPDIPNTTYSICGIDLEVSFNGSITLEQIGEMTSNVTYTSDGSIPVFITVPIFNGSPKFTLSAANGTTIFDLIFKASKF